MSETLEKLPGKLRRVIQHIICTRGFYASLLLSTPLQSLPSIRTMATDGRRIFFNSAFVEGHTEEDLTFVLLHELEHITHQHSPRRQGRDPELWNIAADYVINLDLIDQGLPAPRFMGRFIGLYNPIYRDWPTEKVYNHLPKIFKRGTLFKGGKLNRAWYHRINPLWDDVMGECEVDDGEPQFEGRVTTTRAAAAMAIQRATEHASVSHPASVPNHLDALRNPASSEMVTWRDFLWQFMTANSGHYQEDDWRRPNRRVRHRGIRFPSQSGRAISHLVLILDVSGSMKQCLQSFLSELRNVVRQFRPLKTDILMVDDQIRGHWEFGVETCPDDPAELLHSVDHGGGTDLTAGFEWIERAHLRSPTVICFTDMMSPFPETFQHADRCLFVSDNHWKSPPFGHLIAIQPR